MDGMLFETLIFIDSLIINLNSGLSVIKAIENASKENNFKINEFAQLFLQNILKGHDPEILYRKLKKTENKILFIILNMGVRGLPILQILADFKKEVSFSNKIEIENYQKILPFKLLIPLLFFYFPALILLFIGPFVVDLMKTFETM